MTAIAIEGGKGAAEDAEAWCSIPTPIRWTRTDLGAASAPSGELAGHRPAPWASILLPPPGALETMGLGERPARSVAVGERALRWREGDHVTQQRAAAAMPNTPWSMPRRRPARCPRASASVEAAGLPERQPSPSGSMCSRAGALKAGETLLVHGATSGASGRLAIQMAGQVAGFFEVIATSRGAHKAAQAPDAWR